MKVKDLRPEAVGFITGVIWSLQQSGEIAFDLVVDEARKRWPPFDPPTEAEIKAGKAPKLGN